MNILNGKRLSTNADVVYRKVPYFEAHKTHRPIRHTVIFLLEILEKKMMNVF